MYNLGGKPKLDDMFSCIPDEALLGIDDVAELLNMSQESVRRWCRQGRLPAYRFGGKYIITGTGFKQFALTSRTLSRGQTLVQQTHG